MPIRPPPRTYVCPACGWSKTVAPRSDVLIPGRDHFSVCPKCHGPLKSRPANAIEQLFAEVFDPLIHRPGPVR
ncbi:MAG: hypothetical protein LBT97_10490 [Planctomycetota bacterium]|jgi:hypothetical protein|nr:hypothetical protein [Planctomycetota bacterium]